MNTVSQVGRRAKQAVTLVLGLTLTFSVNLPAYAVPEDEPSMFSMTGDLLVARPVGAAITALGAAVFVVSLPFTALGGNVRQAADTLVVAPGRETFVRCLGCINSGRYHAPKPE